MNAVVGKDCKLIRIESEALSTAFSSGDLKKMTLKAKHNCCAGRSFEQVLDFVYPDPICDWGVFFATDEVDPAICVSPDGATCVDKYYTKLRGVYISNNGTLLPIQSREFDIVTDTAATIKTDLDAGLKAAGYRNASAFVEIKDLENDQYSIEIIISGLPNGIVPHSIIMANDTPCYAQPYFTCEGSLPGAECVKYESRYDLPNTPILGGDLNIEYKIRYMLLRNPSTGLSEKVSLNFTFFYDANNPAPVDFTTVKNIVSAWLVLRGLDADIVFDMFMVNNRIFTTFTGTYEGFEPVRFFLENVTNETVTQIGYDCAEFSVPDPHCAWEALVETANGSFIDSVVTALWVQLEPGAVTQNILSDTYDLRNTADRDALKTAVETWFADNAYPDVIFTATAEAGLDGDSAYRLRIEEFPHPVYAVRVQSTSGEFKEFKFICGAILHVPAGYDPGKLEFIPEGLIIKPSLLGGGTSIPDGVYAITLITETKEGIKTTERSCQFVSCVIKCNMISALAKDLESDIHHYYEAIENAADCPDCECEKACVLYEQLLKKVNKILGGNAQLCPCSGC